MKVPIKLPKPRKFMAMAAIAATTGILAATVSGCGTGVAIVDRESATASDVYVMAAATESRLSDSKATLAITMTDKDTGGSLQNLEVLQKNKGQSNWKMLESGTVSANIQGMQSISAQVLSAYTDGYIYSSLSGVKMKEKSSAQEAMERLCTGVDIFSVFGSDDFSTLELSENTESYYRLDFTLPSSAAESIITDFPRNMRTDEYAVTYSDIEGSVTINPEGRLMAQTIKISATGLDGDDQSTITCEITETRELAEGDEELDIDFPDFTGYIETDDVETA